jgi:hypothetical protein
MFVFPPLPQGRILRPMVISSAARISRASK